MAKNEIKAVSESDTKADAKTNETATAEIKDQNGGKYVYIGPSLPNEKLMSNTIISGEKKEIVEYYKEVIERFPNVERLIVPVERLADCRTKIRSSGNVMNKYYNDLVEQIRQKGAAE